MPPLLIRPSTDADVPTIAAIYAHHVLHGGGTFELEPPDETEMQRRRADVLAKPLPWLIAERNGVPLGYAYANHFRPRRAYRAAWPRASPSRPSGRHASKPPSDTCATWACATFSRFS